MLPDVNEVYPQLEQVPVQKCDNARCKENLYEGDEIIEYAGHHYCDKSCVIDDMLLQGHALKITIGR